MSTLAKIRLFGYEAKLNQVLDEDINLNRID